MSTCVYMCIDSRFLYRKRDVITFLGQEMLSTHISSPRNIIYSHFFAKKRYQPAGSVMGKATAKHFRVVSIGELLSFVEWDMKQNNLFTLWGIVLRQQVKGVPIGGFLSAQLMCLCLLAVEYSFVHSPHRIAVLRPILDTWPLNLPPIALAPGPCLTFPFVSIVPQDPGHFNKSGMSGWFQQDATCLFKLEIEGHTIPVVCIELWDNHLEGRWVKLLTNRLSAKDISSVGTSAHSCPSTTWSLRSLTPPRLSLML